MGAPMKACEAEEDVEPPARKSRRLPRESSSDALSLSSMKSAWLKEVLREAIAKAFTGPEERRVASAVELVLGTGLPRASDPLGASTRDAGDAANLRERCDWISYFSETLDRTQRAIRAVDTELRVEAGAGPPAGADGVPIAERAAGQAAEARSTEEEEEAIPARLGPTSRVCLDPAACRGEVRLDAHRLDMESLSNFCSARTNVCVVSGAWQYEVTLGTAGIQQMGWATPTCPFTNEEGVGDFPDSYAFDGKRVRKWNVSCHPYGQPWMPGDVIGCCFDVDGGEISFFRNGKPLGMAFTGVRRHLPGLAYFPAFSLSHGERCCVNFGGRPFRHAVPGFAPIQDPPRPSSLLAGKMLLECLRLLAERKDGAALFDADEWFLLRNMVHDRLAPSLRCPFFLETSLLPSLVNELQGTEGGGEAAGGTLVESLEACLEDTELAEVAVQVIARVSDLCRSTLYAGQPTGHGEYLAFVARLLRSERIRAAFFASDAFCGIMERLLHHKQPNSHDLATLLPQVWWQGARDLDGVTEQRMVELGQQLERLVDRVESLQLELVLCVMEWDTPLFKKFLAALLAKNRGALRNVQPAGLSDNSVLMSLYFVLVRLVRPVLAEEGGGPPMGGMGSILPRSAFPELIVRHPEPEHFKDVSRLGGAYSHLRKTVASSDLDPTMPPIESCPQRHTHGKDEQSAAHHQRFLHALRCDLALLPAVLDAIVWLFHFGVSVKCKQASMQVQNQATAISQLEDTRRRIAKAEATNPEYHNHLKEACAMFLEDVVESVRQCTWHRAVLYSLAKQEAMFAFCAFQAHLLLALSSCGPLFQFVPECYAETLLESFHALRRGEPPFATVRSLLGHGLKDIITFLVTHFNDKRIVNPEVRDVLLQSTSALLQYRDFVCAFEENAAVQQGMIAALLSCFDSRFWIPVSNILLRMCKGVGFGQKSTESTSLIMQQLLQDTCKGDPALYDAFMNKLFSIMNWTATEFTVSMKDIESAVTGWAGTSSERQQQQRKCTVMFELTVNLLRLLEFVIRELPYTFLRGSKMNLSRLVETISFVLQHTTLGPDSQLFDQLLGAQVQQYPFMDKISRFSILAPITGILINLHIAAQARSEGVSAPEAPRPLLDAILANKSCRLECFEYLQQFISGHNLVQDAASMQRFGHFKDFVQMLGYAEKDREAQTSLDDLADIPDEFLDPIQCTLMRDPVRLPGSGVTVDRGIIERHLLSCATDPFNRSPLTLEMMEGCEDEELRARIESWVEEKTGAKQ